jgi:hypothetical protein
MNLFGEDRIKDDGASAWEGDRKTAGRTRRRALPDVAVSLPPCESLLLPFNLFPAIVKKYAQHAYPYVSFALLPTNSAPGPADRPK